MLLEQKKKIDNELDLGDELAKNSLNDLDQVQFY
jgi:hypothetical protein